jgi:hypothetical protein
MTAGDLYIDVRPDSLRHVHASVSIGDLHARSLGIENDGFKNSLDWFGDGQYTLDARLFAGDVVLPMIASHMQRCETVGRSAKPT